MGSASCETPSTRVDGADLQGVFDRDGGTASALPAGSAARAPTSASASASSASATPPAPPRTPEGEGCVETSGRPRLEVSRTLGRPACRGAEVLEWRDPTGAPRYACLFAASGGAGVALPLILFFHGDGPGLDSPIAVSKQTGLRGISGSHPLGGPAARPGFHVLAVQGRALAGGNAATFDAEATGRDNPDLATIDSFVDQVVARGIVDRRRLYAVGQGPGGQMAATWAMLHADRVAAFAAVAAPPPTARWTCPGPPPPAVVMYRACDALLSCEAVESWLGTREAARARTRSFRLGDDVREVLHCEPRNSCGSKRGTASHSRWPKGAERRLLDALGEHALALPAPTP